MSTHSLLVLKFGGTSLATPQKFKDAAKIICNHLGTHSHVLCVVSAMGHATDELLDLAKAVSPHFRENAREVDMLLTAGERISMALMSLALGEEKISCISFTGSQSGIITTADHGNARIKFIKPQRIEDALKTHRVVIVAGFQGVSESKEVTTLGRGGSDTTALAMAAALHANKVIIYTDVDGFYSGDPRKAPDARHIARLSWLEAAQITLAGAGIMHARSMLLALKHKIALYICDHQNPWGRNTLIKGDNMLEEPIALSLAHKKDLYQVRLDSTNFDKFMAIMGHALAYRKEANAWWAWLNLEQKNKLLSALPSLIAHGPYHLYTLCGSNLQHKPELIKQAEALLASFKIHDFDLILDPLRLEILVRHMPASLHEDALYGALHAEFFPKTSVA